jgi:hypothetical protein
VETDAADGNPLTTRIPTAAWKAQNAFHSSHKARRRFHHRIHFFERQRSTLNTLSFGPKDGEHLINCLDHLSYAYGGIGVWHWRMDARRAVVGGGQSVKAPKVYSANGRAVTLLQAGVWRNGGGGLREASRLSGQHFLVGPTRHVEHISYRDGRRVVLDFSDDDGAGLYFLGRRRGDGHKHQRGPERKSRGETPLRGKDNPTVFKLTLHINQHFKPSPFVCNVCGLSCQCVEEGILLMAAAGVMIQISVVVTTRHRCCEKRPASLLDMRYNVHSTDARRLDWRDRTADIAFSEPRMWSKRMVNVLLFL